MLRWSRENERGSESVAAVRSHQVLPDLDLGIRCCTCNCQILCVHYDQANCVDQEAYENHCLGSTGCNMGILSRYLCWDIGLLPAGVGFV